MSQPFKPTQDQIIEALSNAVSRAAAEVAQIRRVLWAAAHQAGGKLIIDESSVPVLWGITSERGNDNKLILSAVVAPDISDEQKTALATRLLGTSDSIRDVQKELGLDVYPESYLLFHLSPLAIWSGDRWRDAALVKAEQAPTGQN